MSVCTYGNGSTHTKLACYCELLKINAIFTLIVSTFRKRSAKAHFGETQLVIQVELVLMVDVIFLYNLIL